ncbi:hypothetical protein [Campylobacter canadensis]|uniref:DUF4105 domain-containing protein n=1 Tax=Campylobacter canadensis TaxID=449520 RepID=A0ABS7WT50_9BACT|nr:hypothetical protein [Campylobacter canadensis]MBZ7987472.1 hypothetical protein [Campylobacter canadensis]MBZ7994815.1 hypothetical protein [Campylobacter canadensis]MBZ7996400.1 hypothetical protein [Campylobacter canadensis]MBZ7998434.1 hypothetical protein [Campylobacter canadensis]MBZ8000148.1 hypothetical protein [Campylobacter canadensis]
MKKFIFLFFSIFAFASEFELCFVEENYKNFDEIFGHIYLKHKNKALHFSIDTYNVSLVEALKSFYKNKALYELVDENKLRKFYNNNNRKVFCENINTDEDLSILFKDKKDYYSFFYKNCSSALYFLAKENNIKFKNSIIPQALMQKNTNYKHYFSHIAFFYDFKTKSYNPSLTLLEFNHSFNHYLTLFNIDKNRFLFFKISEFNNFSYSLDFSIDYKFRANSNFFLGYEYKGFFLGFDNYALAGGYFYNFTNSSINLYANKKDFNIKFLYDYKSFRTSLKINKKSAKIGIFLKF